MKSLFRWIARAALAWLMMLLCSVAYAQSGTTGWEWSSTGNSAACPVGPNQYCGTASAICASHDNVVYNVQPDTGPPATPDLPGGGPGWIGWCQATVINPNYGLPLGAVYHQWVKMWSIGCGGIYGNPCSAPPAQKGAGAPCPPGCGTGGVGAADAGTGPTIKGNPVDVANANKYQSETDYVGAGTNPIRFTRSYSSVTGYLASGGQLAGQPLLGAEGWSATYFQYLRTVGSTLVEAYRPDGRVLAFNGPGNGVYAPDADAADRLIQTSSGWQYHTADDTIETYNASGQLQSVAARGRAPVNVTYASGATNPGDPPQSVSDAFGHSLQFGYQAGYLGSLTDPNGQTLYYTIDSTGRPSQVKYADLTTRGYGYDTGNQWLLANVTDESQVQYASWTYLNSGAQVQSSQHAGGVEKYSFTSSLNGTAGSVTVQDPLGQSRTYNQSFIFGRYHTTSASATCPGCGEDASRTYDGSGNVSASSDFNGNQTKYAYDTTRNLETSRTEGLTSTGAATPRTRTTTTSWDANWRQPQVISVYTGASATGTPLRTTTFAYDGDTGVSCGGATGSLCTKTITDTTVTPNVTRIWSYTYDSYGRVLTAKGPRTDVNDTTTYTYYTCTTGGACGQVQTVKDALGHITTYNTYNAHGQPTQITDPNGVVSTLAYDLRMRLTDRCVNGSLPSCSGGELTHFTYWPTGLLKQATLPDASFIQYTYDPAHRLTELTDQAGNTLKYTLDNMGNRTAENAYDPTNALHRTHTRVINALNELYQEVNAAGTAAVTTTFGYDNNGNQTSIAAPLSRNTGNTYDELNRLSQTTDPNSGTTQFSYDALDNLTQVVDPRNLTTGYGYNGFGDLKTQTSPDTGATTNTYDSGGNLQTSTDARGAIATYGYDALNRSNSVSYALGTVTDQTITFTYDQGTNGIGHLTGASDANHSMAWTYDPWGRVTGKSQIVAGVTRAVGYGYTNGDLTSLKTPSGQTITYGYTNHQVTSVVLNGATLVQTVTYEPFGPVNGWTWANATTTTRTYDLDQKISKISSAGLKTYTYDDAFRITGYTDTTTGDTGRTYGYDLLDRVTSDSLVGTWTYDANGNRMSQTGSSASTYTISTTNNQISSISGALRRTYQYDNAGNTLSYSRNTTLTYNNRGRLSSLKNGSVTETLLYNAVGQMMSTSGGAAGTVIYMYDESGHLVGEYTSTGGLIQETVWLGDIPIATLRPNGTSISVYYVHTDHLNAPHVVTRASDNMQIWTWFPPAFGDGLPNSNPAGLGTFTYNLRLPGQVYDPQAGLHQNGYRDYDPNIGRYVESDPIGLKGGINTYVYVRNRPVSRIDRFGLDDENAVDKAIQLLKKVCKKGDETCQQYAERIYKLCVHGPLPLNGPACKVVSDTFAQACIEDPEGITCKKTACLVDSSVNGG